MAGCGGASPVSGWGSLSNWNTLLKAAKTQDTDEDGMIEKSGWATWWQDEGYRPEIDVNNNNFHEPEELFYMALDSEDFSVDDFIGFGDSVVDLAQRGIRTIMPSDRAIQNFAGLLMRINSEQSKAGLRQYIEFCPAEKNTQFSASAWEKIMDIMLEGFSDFDPKMQEAIVLALVKGLCSPIAEVKEFAQTRLDNLLANESTTAIVLETFSVIVDSRVGGFSLYVTAQEQAAMLIYLSQVQSPDRVAVFVKALSNADVNVVRTAATALLAYELDRETVLSLLDIDINAAIEYHSGFAATSTSRNNATSTVRGSPERKDAVVHILEKTNDPVVIPFLYAYRSQGLANLAFGEVVIIDALISDGLTSEDEKIQAASENALARRGDAVLPKLQKAYVSGTLSYEEYLKLLGEINTIGAQRKLAAVIADHCAGEPDETLCYLYQVLGSEYTENSDAEEAGAADILNEVDETTAAFLAASKAAGKKGGALDKNTFLGGQVYFRLNSMKYDIEPWLKEMKADAECGPALKNIAQQLLVRIETRRRTNPIFLEDVSKGDQRGTAQYSYQHGLAVRVLALPVGTAFCRLYLDDPRTGIRYLQEDWEPAFIYKDASAAEAAATAAEWVGPDRDTMKMVQGSTIEIGFNSFTIYLDSRNSAVPATLNLYNNLGQKIRSLHFTVRNPGIEPGI